MPHAASRVLNVSASSRYEVDMAVANRLSRRLSAVHANVEPRYIGIFFLDVRSRSKTVKA